MGIIQSIYLVFVFKEIIDYCFYNFQVFSLFCISIYVAVSKLAVIEIFYSTNICSSGEY